MSNLASVDLLRNVPVFSGLADQQLEAIARSCRLASTRAGSSIVSAGDMPAALYILLSGQVRVVDGRGDGAAAQIDVLGRGAHVGESVLDATPAPFTVHTMTDVDLLTLARDDLSALKSAWPDIEVAIRDFLDARLHAGGDERLLALPPSPAPPAVPRARAVDEPNRPLFDHALRIQWKRRAYESAGRSPRRMAVRHVRASDSGAACVAAVCRHYGRRIAVGRARELANSVRSGASLRGLQRAAEALGCETLATVATIDQLFANALPAIVSLVNRHWVVVTAIDTARISVADPVSGSLRTYSRSDFLGTWTGETLFLRPTDAFADVEDDRPALARLLPYVRPMRLLV